MTAALADINEMSNFGFMNVLVTTGGPKVSRNVRYARRWRDWLLHALGPFCVACGATDDLTFDCKSPAGHSHHVMPWHQRIAWYRRQALKGNVVVLCRPCNSRKGKKELPRYLPVVDKQG